MNCLSLYRDHKKLYVGDARGRVYSWSVSDTAGLYAIVWYSSLKNSYCRFQVTFQRAVPKFVANLPITFPSSEIGRELRNKVCKFISRFEFCL